MRLIYDIEVYPNFFCVGFEDADSSDTYQFEISERKSELNELRLFMKKVKVLIGYNNESYDDKVLTEILKLNLNNDKIYSISQEIINNVYKNVYPRWVSIDLMKLHASSNGRVSLKEMQVSMCWHKVQDLPYDFRSKLTFEQMQNVCEYNFNDIKSTKMLASHLVRDINLRVNIQKRFGLKCLSKDSVNTGVDLFAKIYSEKVGNNNFLDKRTFRESINLGDCILDSVSFKSKQFKDLLETLKNTTIRQTKGALTYSVIYGGVKHVYGTGGIHSKDNCGIIKPSKGWLYEDADVDRRRKVVNCWNLAKVN